jgi:hypothetical protein
MANRLFALHWRLREFSLRPQPIAFVQFASKAWFGPLDLSGVAIADGDLAIDGIPIVKAPPARFRSCLSTLLERHLAINWLAGGNSIYSEVDVST